MIDTTADGLGSLVGKELGEVLHLYIGLGPMLDDRLLDAHWHVYEGSATDAEVLRRRDELAAKDLVVRAADGRWHANPTRFGPAVL